MTEKQGGSDVRANTTRAVPLGAGGPGGEYAITGHKWFCSAPMCDVFLVLAHTERGLSCFCDAALAARRHAQPLPPPAPEGQARQPLERVERGRVPRRMGPHGRRRRPRRPDHHRDGESHAARLRDRLVGRHAAGARAGAAPHRHRRAFGKRLVEQPLMQNVLADLCIECEAATTADDADRAGLRRRRAGRGAGVRAARHGGHQVLGVQAPAGHASPRRSSASAATATSRSPSCRGSSARRR